MTVVEPILKEHPFFRGIESRYIDRIADQAVSMNFAAGRLIFRQGELANQFYIITRGRVALEVFAPQHGAIPLMTLESGDVLGWSWLFEPYTWHFDARALEDTQAIAMDGAGLRVQCDENHELGYQLMKHSVHIIEQRLQAVMIQMIDVYDLTR